MKLTSTSSVNNLRISLVLLYGLGLTVVSGTFDPQVICTLLANGTKINDPRACNAWIVCVDGEPIGGTCGTDLFYDRESEECVPSSNITCISSNPCAAVQNGFVADPYSCSDYYYCLNGNGTHGQCNSGMNYNPGTEDCIRNFTCTQTMLPDSYCNILPDGVFIKDPTSCNGYQMCWQGVVINGTCPDTFYFSAANGECEYPQNVTCAITEEPLIAKSGECSSAGQFVSDGSTCNGYYYCQQLDNGEMELVHGECASAYFFSAADGGACVPRSQIHCDYDRCAGLGETNIQLANESDDDCTGYAICQSGVSIGSGLCPSDEYFDELTQRCTTQLISYPACALSAASSTSTPQGEQQTVTMINDDTSSDTSATIS
ncbi:peritrophin-48 [Scaptodrosophila lebanonensis]|uniref:Peritrophin-48 n=1 Tax=Drosophila lebanonensis TaxID=7225 RepID=A0A6J2TA91_DROLE|nr:peritrophin-48 [Scaptodrosophila lebanonensis]